ncbi:MAG: lysylphosphatidylglycerol synthase transmembrane domain-containing protein [Nitrospinales bacterium]
MKKYSALIISSVIAVLAVYYTARNISMKELMDSFRTLHYFYLILSFFIFVFLYWARTLRWKMLILPIKPVKLSQLYSPLMVGFMAGVLPARVGEIVRAYLLAKNQNIPFASSLATIVIERLFDLIFLLILFAWLLVFQSDIWDHNIAWSGISVKDLAFQFGIFSLILIGALLTFIYLLICHKPKAVELVHWFLKPFPEAWRYKVEHLLEAFSDGLAVVKDIKSLAYISLSTTLVWGLIILSYCPFYWAYDLQDKSLASMVLVVVMVCILITVLPTPAFLGSFNAGVFIALHLILNESEVSAVSFGMVAWTINFAVITLGGVYFILHDHISVTQLADEIQDEEI